jgi:hypothetical protein
MVGAKGQKCGKKAPSPPMNGVGNMTPGGKRTGNVVLAVKDKTASKVKDYRR